MTTEELGIIVFFISTLIKQYYHSHGGYYIKLNDDHTVDKNTVISIYYNGYYYQNE